MNNLWILSILVVAVVLSVNAGNDYLWGESSGNDTLVSTETVTKLPSGVTVVKKKYVYKPDSGKACRISQIKITDKKKKNGATATLVKGGPGTKAATIKFISQRGSGISDEVEIYCRKKKN